MSPTGDDPAARVRTLLLRGDNVMKSARPERFERALEAFEEARGVAADPAVEPRVRDLIDRRIESLRALIGSRDE
ncbi:MAG: hypothetical protein QOJ07_1202 [Thermoleophilaceae bacterium]|nr:hypothetical protein [Thermoleophilaceae bacterium]